MNGDVWRTPSGEICIETCRRMIGHHELVEVLVPAPDHMPFAYRRETHEPGALVSEPARYHGARAAIPVGEAVEIDVDLVEVG